MRIAGIALVALMGLAWTVAAGEKDKDIVDTAVANGSFKTLAKLLGDAGLVDALKGEGPFTVFAPTDDAFAKLPKATLEKVGKDKELLKKILTSHVVKGKVMAADAIKLDGKEAAALSGVKLGIKVKDGSVYVSKSKVVKADVTCKNGVIHVIDTVIVPE
ncbi:MAG: fasciclin domain-containing protein [Gemmataceae bacterium]|nr:fasciclin domain-containing protein [Gemmataceae bacterium]